MSETTICPGCGKVIRTVHGQWIRNHKKDNGVKCAYSNHYLQGFQHWKDTITITYKKVPFTFTSSNDEVV